MSKNQNEGAQGELSDQQLDGVAGGQEVRKMEKIVVTASRSEVAPQQVVKMDKIVVTARREDKEQSIAGSQIAQADVSGKK